MIQYLYENKTQFLLDIDDCLARGASEEARAMCEQWLNQFPGDVEVRLYLGRSFMALDRLEQALTVLKGVEHTLLQLGSVYIHMGDIYSVLRENYEALSCYVRYLDLFPDSQKVQEVTEKTNALLGNPERELSEEGSYQSIEAVSTDFHTLTLADLYIKQGHIDMARDVLKSILAKDSENVIAAKKLNELEAIFNYNKTESCEEDHKKSTIISELTVWLNNIDRLRNRQPVH
jgi:tetratricopeptide (TPR) repeat protein